MSGLKPIELPPPPTPSCVIKFMKDEKKLTSDGRQEFEEKVDFPAIVISFSDFNVKMKAHCSETKFNPNNPQLTSSLQIIISNIHVI